MLQQQSSRGLVLLRSPGVFPQAHVLVLSRNFADLRLHYRVFGSYQVHYSQFSKVTNQMVAMNPNVGLVDIDGWQNDDAIARYEHYGFLSDQLVDRIMIMKTDA